MKLKYSPLLVILFFGIYLVSSFFSVTKNPTRNVLSVQETSAPQTPDVYSVVKVVDGDTIDILVNGKKERMRIIGINSPETVDPRRPVECFGKEASDYAKKLLLSKTVKLKSDPTQADKDKYGRLLRYIYLPDGTDFGLVMIQEGYAYEYTYDVPYQHQAEYKKAQIEAENGRKGLWSDTSCSRKK